MPTTKATIAKGEVVVAVVVAEMDVEISVVAAVDHPGVMIEEVAVKNQRVSVAATDRLEAAGPELARENREAMAEGDKTEGRIKVNDVRGGVPVAIATTGGGRGGNFRGRDDRGRHREPLPAGVQVRFIAENAGIESLARQIKATGRAYSVFDLAKLVLSARERYSVEFFRTKEAPEGMRFFQCKLDDSLWLSQEDALRHALTADGLSDYYVSEEVVTDGPKGNFTVIAVCGMSGVLLGPPNHHDYQKDLTRLHQERFANMHIEGFKRRIRMEKDEETIEKWKAEKSKQTHYTYQKTAEGEEPVVLKSTADMERHCRENHLADFVAPVDSAKVPGNIPAKALAPPLLAVLRNELEQQKRFPMNTVKILCRQLEDQGLKFFKDEDGKKKKTTYVCRSRPRALQGATGLSERIRKIVGLVRDNPGIDYAVVVSSMLPGQKISAATANAGKKTDTPKKAEVKPERAKTPDSKPAAEAPAKVEETPTVESPQAEPDAVKTPRSNYTRTCRDNRSRSNSKFHSGRRRYPNQ